MRYASSYRLIRVLAALAAPAYLAGQAVPSLASEGIVSSTDSSPAGLGLARGSLFTIYGSNLASGTASASSLPYPTTLAGATVHFRSGTTVIDAPLLYASPSQINAIVPSGMTGASADISVETAAGESQRQTVAVVDSRFTAFATGLLPFGPTLVQQYRPSGITLNRLLDPAVPGDALVIWGTGLGSDVRQDVTIHIGGASVTPFYAGPAPGQPGLSQINFYLPSGTPSRCFIPLVVRVGTQDVAEYTISTAAGSGSDCESEIPLSRESRQTLDQGGTIRLAALAVTAPDNTINLPGSYIPGTAAESWQAQYNSSYLSQVATYDAPGAAPVVCTRSAYTYTDTTPALPVLPTQFYGLGPAWVLTSVTGPSGCRWPFQGFQWYSNYVSRASEPFGCPAQQFALGDSNSGGPFSGALPVVPAPDAPEIHLSRSATAVSVSWANPSGARLALEISSLSTIQSGGMFGGSGWRNTVQKLTCRLSGSSGTGEISRSDFDWAHGLPSKSIFYRLSPAAAIYASWSTPISAALVRASRVVSGPIAIYDN